MNCSSECRRRAPLDGASTLIQDLLTRLLAVAHLLLPIHISVGLAPGGGTTASLHSDEQIGRTSEEAKQQSAMDRGRIHPRLVSVSESAGVNQNA